MKIRRLLISYDKECIVITESIEQGRVKGIGFSEASPEGIEDEWFLDHFEEYKFNNAESN